MGVPEADNSRSRSQRNGEKKKRKGDSPSPGDANRAAKKRRAKSNDSSVGQVEKIARPSSQPSSLRHLFSFGAGGKGNSAVKNGGESKSDKTTTSSGKAVKEQGCDSSLSEFSAPKAGPFSLSSALNLHEDDTVQCEAVGSSPRNTTADIQMQPAVAAVDKGDTQVPEVPNGNIRLPHVAPREPSDGLASEKDADVLALAESFCGAERRIEDLESKWFGGQRESLREELRLRRMKRLRGRAR